MSKATMNSSASPLTSYGAHALVAGLAVLVLAFCLSVEIPAWAREGGCPDSEASHQFCNQSSSPHPFTATVPRVPPVGSGTPRGGGVSPSPLPLWEPSYQLTPSAPRAPPSFLL